MFTLSETPEYHPDCCLSLSRPLLQTVRHYAQLSCHSVDDKVLLLSIGAGTGMFEAYLNADLIEHGLDNIRVEAVEVQSAIVPYLPENVVHRVGGSWATSKQAQRARVLLFVYPRDPHLFKKYLVEFSARIQYVLWFGPRIDWPEYEQMSHNLSVFETVIILEHAGLTPYELAVVFESKAYTSANHMSVSREIWPSDCLDIDSV